MRQGRHERLHCFLEKKQPRKGRPSRDWRERRNVIRLTTEHTVETLVVADADMVQYHGAEAAQRFILTVMHMVSPAARAGSGGPVSSWRSVLLFPSVKKETGPGDRGTHSVGSLER